MSKQNQEDTSKTAFQDEGGTAVETKPKKRPARPKLNKLPPCKLLLHNDDVNPMDEVVLAIVELTPLEPHFAIQKMLEAHYSGTALLLTTHKERAELYVQQFASKRITTSIETC